MEPSLSRVTVSTSNLSFKRAVTTISGYVIFYQIIILGLSFYYGFDPDTYPLRYFYIVHLLGMVWTIIFATHAIIELHRAGLLSDLVKRTLHPESGKIVIIPLLYFLGCTVIILLFNSFGLQEHLLKHDSTIYLKTLSFVSAVILAPILEEIIFRGYLYQSMFSEFRHKNERTVVNGMLFAAAHVFFVNFVIHASVPYYIFVLGFLLATLYENTRSLFPCILLHMLNNALVFGLEILHINISILNTIS